MENLTELYDWLHNEGVMMISRSLPFSNLGTKAAAIKLLGTGTYGIFVDMPRIETTAEEKVIMFHEGGHYATGATHEVSSKYDLIEKHEHLADRWAIEQVLSAADLDAAVADGYTDIWSLADHFDVTPDFMRKAVCLYTFGNLDDADYLPM